MLGIRGLLERLGWREAFDPLASGERLLRPAMSPPGNTKSLPPARHLLLPLEASTRPPMASAPSTLSSTAEPSGATSQASQPLRPINLSPSIFLVPLMWRVATTMHPISLAIRLSALAEPVGEPTAALRTRHRWMASPRLSRAHAWRRLLRHLVAPPRDSALSMMLSRVGDWLSRFGVAGFSPSSTT